MRSGVILAGGRSTRFVGGDKAVADLAGTPMIRRVADRISPVVDELIVNCREEQVERISDVFDHVEEAPRIAVDTVPDRGPLAGIHYGLTAASGPYTAVVGCDMPFVDPVLIGHLFDIAEGHDAAIPRLDDQWFQTTQAVYRTDAMEAACNQALSDGGGKILDAVFQLDYIVIDEVEIRKISSLNSFENINTRAELEEAAKKIEALEQSDPG